MNENIKGLGTVRWRSSNNNTSWNIIVAFLERCDTQGKWSETKKLRGRQHVKTNTALKWTKSHIINVLLSSFAQSVRLVLLVRRSVCKKTSVKSHYNVATTSPREFRRSQDDVNFKDSFLRQNQSWLSRHRHRTSIVAKLHNHSAANMNKLR